ncbi:MAG: TlpA family protein disulfide reductase [Wenzhouxiangella sp.]
MSALSQGVSLGPLGLNLGLVLGLIALIGAGLVAWALDRRRDLGLVDSLFNLLIWALLFGRLVLIARHGDRFDGLWSMIDIRDRGFDGWGLTLGAALYLAWLTWRDRPRLAWTTLVTGLGLGLFGLMGLIASQLHDWPDSLPDLVLSDLEGQPVALSEWRDNSRPLVVNIWATWCPPCRREMPALAQARRDHPDVDFLLINQAETLAVVTEFLKQQNLLDEPVLIDAQNAFSDTLGVRVLPTTLFFDANGRLDGQHVGEISRAVISQRLGQ